MRISFRNITYAWVAVCLLAPAGIKIGGATVLDLSVYSMLALSLLCWLVNGARLRSGQKVERWLGYLATVILLSYLLNAFAPFEEQKAFVAFLGVSSSDFLFARLSIYGFMTLVMIIGAYRMAARSLTSIEHVETLVGVVLVSGLINAVITTVYWLFNTGATFGRYNFLPPIEQSQGVHLNYMSLVCLLAISLIASGEVMRFKRGFLYLVALASCFSMLTVLVRQGWVMFIITLCLWFFLYSARFPSVALRKGMISLSLFFLALIGVVVTSQQELLARWFGEIFSISGTDSNQGSWLIRFALIGHGITVFMEHPLLGVGYGHYIAYSTVPVMVAGAARYVASPHNGVVTVLAETGVVGLFCLAGISLRLWQQHYRTYRCCSGRFTTSVVSAVFAVLIVAVISQLISNSQLLPLPAERTMTQSSFILWILFGSVAAIAKIYGRQDASAQVEKGKGNAEGRHAAPACGQEE